MIQTALFFFLGFLAAGFLALLVAPAIWRRAVLLTRRQIEGAMPLTSGEIQASKDLLRAGFAAQTRKLEMKIRTLKERSNEQALEMERNREQIRHLMEERDAASGRIEEMERVRTALDVELGTRRDEQGALATQLDERETLLDERAAEIERLGRMYDEASFLASSRQIELVASETRAEKLSNDLATARHERKEAERGAREALAESKSQLAALRAEQKKVTSLEKQVERLMAAISAAEEKLERRERELARLRERTRNDNKSERTLQSQLTDEQDRRATLEERLTTLTKENRALRSELSQIRRAGGAVASAGTGEGGELRTRISQLAAEVVNLTATLEGPGSPIHKALAVADAGSGEAASLADRIRELQKASAGQP